MGIASLNRGAGVSRLPKAPHPTLSERVIRGQVARDEVPTGSHAGYEAVPARADPVAILERQAQDRVPELVPIRYGRMLVSPFTFYRGAAAIMAADLSATPDIGIRVQLCGDAHLSNFGVYAAPDRRLVFDINDFDETLPGPWEWDVKRLAASFEIAGRDRAFSAGDRRKLVRTNVRAYREAMAQFAGMHNLDVWYARVDVDTALEEIRAKATGRDAREIERRLTKLQSRDSLAAFAKLTHLVDGQPQFRSKPPLLVPVEDLPGGAAWLESVRDVLREYRRTLPEDRRHLLRQFQLTHLARKVVGVGSVGTRAFVMLLMGTDGADPLVLQAKEAGASVLEPYLGRSAFANHGQRVVEGQRMMQAASDIFLGWHRAVGVDNATRDFYVRQLWDAKFSPDVDAMPFDRMLIYARLCGWTLARAHARSGDRVAIAAYLGEDAGFDRALADFAVAYADQTEADYELLRAAVKEGRIHAEVGI